LIDVFDLMEHGVYKEQYFGIQIILANIEERATINTS